ncbi:MAG TPA: SRPBCC family protein [Verrucomicrobiae bacterium]|jgi:uncharacterized protein YndB with AHSA1/START domain|nr:SRPBCC family protein [Verrucomicrobiae bacterium]
MDSPNIKATVVREYPVSPLRVFNAWLDTNSIGHWMFGPEVRDEEIVSLGLDPRVGGGFSFVVRRDGDEVDHVGEYLVIEPPKRLAFTWGVRQDGPARSVVMVKIDPAGDGCVLTLTHELHPDWAHFKERVEAAWSLMLNALAKTLK